jgi:hypothetical protein
MIFKVLKKYKKQISKIVELEERILKLEDENISLTNELYRLENSIDSRIDIIINDLISQKNK